MANNVLNWVWNHSQSRHAARLVLLAIADRAHEDGAAWPSNAELKRMTGLGERAVQTAVTELAKMKELQVLYQQGPGGVNRYRVLMQVRVKTPAKSAPPPQDLRPAESAPPQDLRAAESEQVNPQTPAESAPPQSLRPPAESAHGTHTKTFTNSPSESSKGGVGGNALFDGGQPPAKRAPRSRAKRANPGPEFERWYAAYPVHKAKGDAEKAWQTEVVAAGADPEALTAAALRYREDPQVRRGYGKYPAGWLRAKCWLDEPTPEQHPDPASNGNGPPVNRRQAADDAMFGRALARARARDAGRTTQ